MKRQLGLAEWCDASGWVRLHEKGGKEHEVPCHHSLEQYLDEYITAAGIAGEPDAPLFQTAAGKTGTLTGKAMWQQDAYRSIQRRTRDTGIKTRIGNHTFRAIGIAAYLKNKGTLEAAQHIANHESPRTTKLYDRRQDEISLDEVERIAPLKSFRPLPAPPCFAKRYNRPVVQDRRCGQSWLTKWLIPTCAVLVFLCGCGKPTTSYQRFVPMLRQPESLKGDVWQGTYALRYQDRQICVTFDPQRLQFCQRIPTSFNLYPTFQI